MTQIVLIDSCYWFGLYDEKDQYHSESEGISEMLRDCTIVIPFPSLYEVLNSTFIRRRTALDSLENVIKSGKVSLLPDDKYRDSALENVYKVHKEPMPKISLVDSIIREILSDTNVRIDALVTYNEKDFKDVCDRRNITILP
ncbi:hypothetical protein [Capnocytophaga canis]|uniref:PIN domain-containing protein n=1 Tax=Capnocytophaga canis TaxID=1848903 RepID=A0A0B7IU72_9FLAO|nr:hypothetical protein [Capnocytophaga canis]CEN54154.1 conserved hypothetical protein [Capnocytophaga canis]